MTAPTRPPNHPSDDSISRLSNLLVGDPMTRLDADLKHVLQVQAELGARPLEALAPQTARRQPKAADAIQAILAVQNRSPLGDGLNVETVTVEAGDEGPGRLVRIYRLNDVASRGNPMVLYFHGGGFVTGDLDSHDASARALAKRSGAIIISADYPLAPEQQFPAAHEAAWQTWLWLTGAAKELGGDPNRIAVAGEDAGANLAANIAIRARDERKLRPIHQLLIHPMAGTDLTTPSYGEALRARPIGSAAMRWRFKHIFGPDADADDARINLALRNDLAGIAPATIFLAEIDPLRSEGEMLAFALEAAHVPVRCQIYEGMAQGFFGLGQVVTKALFAQSDAGQALASAFERRI
jgi:acetyl esterase